MMSNSNEFLFHCFPGRLSKFTRTNHTSKESRQYLDCGLAILESIILNGMLLTPEDIKIPRHKGAEQEGMPPIEVPQTRASFTLSSLDALQTPNPYSLKGETHLDIFGEFSIGLDPIAARDFDMAPVSYYYGTEQDTQNTNSSLAYPLVGSLVHSLTEVREILSVLALLERRSRVARGENTPEEDQIAAQFDKARVRLLYQPEARAKRITHTLETLPASQIYDVLATLDTDRRPFSNLVEAIDLLSGLLQSADSASLHAPLLYFSQREWRLTKVLNERVVGYNVFDSGFGEEQQRRNIRQGSLESIYYIASIMDNQLEEQWLQGCFVVFASAHSNKFFREYIRIITCPAAIYSLVEEVVAKYLGTGANSPIIVPIGDEPL